MPRLFYTPRDSRNPQVGRKALAAGADGFDGVLMFEMTFDDVD